MPMEDSNPIRDEDHVLRAVCSHWLNKIEFARKHKRKVFQDDADEAMSFYHGPRDWDQMMGGVMGGSMGGGEITPDPIFKMNVNKAFEVVSLFGPALYYQNPVRTVNPRVPVEVPPQFFADPYYFQSVQMAEQARVLTDELRSNLLAAYLNFTPTENDLASESRLAIEEGLIKGRCCLWTELSTPPGMDFRVVCSSYDSVDNLMVDPDATEIATATWIAKRCVHPTWQVERDYGLKPGTLKGNMESQSMQAEVVVDDDALYDRKRGLTNDLIVYWKIYSKMGIGGRLSGVARSMRGPLEMFGDYVFLAIAKDIPYPLNLPPDLQDQAGAMGRPPQEVFDAVAWPTPFWAHGAWPMSVLDFHPVANCPWPMSHLKAGMGELKFLNWAMSFLAGKMRNTCRDFIAMKKEAGEDMKTSILTGQDLTLLEIEAGHGTISEIVQFLQHPQINGDIWRVIAAVEENFDKRVGLNELMYGAGGATQIRSAQEAEIRNSNSNVRPEDMAKQVEAWMTDVAVHEAICARYHLQGADIRPVLGDVAAMAWDTYIYSTDLIEVTRQLEYRIESGSTRKPNKEGQSARMNEAVQVMLPVFQLYMQTTGDPGPINNLLADWAKSRDLDPARYQLTAAPPPPTGPLSPQGDPTPTIVG